MSKPKEANKLPENRSNYPRQRILLYHPEFDSAFWVEALSVANRLMAADPRIEMVEEADGNYEAIRKLAEEQRRGDPQETLD